MSVSLVYYGVSYGSVDLGWNPYLTFALTGLIEFPSNLTAIWTAGRYAGNISTVFFIVILLLDVGFYSHYYKGKKLIIL